ncbi:hypothetical protein JCM10212_004737 [Sporobolomyces blumeae]
MATQSASLTPALFKRLHPRPYLDKFLQDSIRPDGRPLVPLSDSNADPHEHWRDATANVGSISTSPSSALVRLGHTTIVCGVSLEVAPPDLARPDQGFLVPNVDLGPLCSPSFRPGPPSDEAQVLSSRLHDILISSNVVPLESLVIEPGKAAFVVYLDLVCLNYDGGALDAAVLAAVQALKHLTLPKATYNLDTGETICQAVTTPPSRSPAAGSSKASRIQLGAEPCAVSFGVFNGHLLPDPTLFESTLCTTQITIVVDSLSLSSSSSSSHRRQRQEESTGRGRRGASNREEAAGKLLRVYQAGAPLVVGEDRGGGGGGGGGNEEVLRRCIALARARADELHKLG